MSKVVQKIGASNAERPSSVLWRMASVPLIGYAIITFLGLVSYDASDVSVLAAPANEMANNWMGVLGAWNAYFFLLCLGLGALLVPVFCVAVGIMMMIGKRLGLKPLWMILFSLSACALLQFANGSFSALLSRATLNLAPNAGGGIGYLLNDRTLAVWIGNGGTAALHGIVLFVAAIMIIGPMAMMEYFYTLRVRDVQVRRRIEDNLEEGVDPAEVRQHAREEERQRVLAEKTAAKEARLAEREQIKGVREAEKARKIAEKEARRIAQSEGEEVIFARPPILNRKRPEVEDIAPPPPSRAVSTRYPEPTRKPPVTTSFIPNEVSYKLPTTKLLHPIPLVVEFGNQAEIDENTAIIEGTLAEFGINVRVAGVISGPVITCYEIKPPPGVRVDKISTYSNDLQMALQARSLRILSPIPGKNVMGIEVPNGNRRTVSLREVAERPEWKAAVQKFALPMLLGMDVSGNPVIADLAKMPHILIAGTTGSGKSVCLNSILAGFMLARTPDDLRLLMVDPKMVEFTPYADLPHLVVPIITAPKKVAAALQWAIIEMKRRLEMFKHAGVRNIASFNGREQAKQTTFFTEDNQNDAVTMPEKLPYIVIVIDEMADLMMSAQAEVEPRVVSLAQLSRAVGIHMILATQRPSVNVITGLIKANFPARIAFKVSQRVDSQTILDSKGAEHLIGMGDMLFSNPNGTLTRAQGTWIDEDEVTELVSWFKKQGDPIYVDEIKSKLDRMVIKPPKEDFGEEGEENQGEEADEDADAELLKKALECIITTRRASTSSIQRVLRIGYNRAARVMDELERRGCIGPANGAAPRDILRTTLNDAEFVDDAEPTDA